MSDDFFAPIQHELRTEKASGTKPGQEIPQVDPKEIPQVDPKESPREPPMEVPAPPPQPESNPPQS